MSLESHYENRNKVDATSMLDYTIPISQKDTDSVVFYHYLVACIQHTILAHTCILDESDQHNIRDYNFLLGVEEYRGLYT